MDKCPHCNNVFIHILYILGKLTGIGSDGASNMVGKKGGLAALLRREVNPEIINLHCFAHRMELAFRDVLKKVNL